MISIIHAQPQKSFVHEASFNASKILQASDIQSTTFDHLNGRRSETDQISYAANYLTIPDGKIVITEREIFYLDADDKFFPDYYPMPWVYQNQRQADGSLVIDTTGLPNYDMREIVYAPFLVAGNWFHTLLDNYARMYYFDFLEFPNLKIVIPFWAARPPASHQNDRHIVNAVFMDGKTSVFLKKGIYHCSRIILPPLGNQNDYIFCKPLNFVAEQLQAHLLPKPARHRLRLFISRSDINVRNISNEAAFVEAIKPFGVIPICPGDYSFRTQLELFSSAELIMGVHGQGFVPMICARDCRKVMEFEAADWKFTAYRSIANCFGIPYEKLSCTLTEMRNPARFDWLAAADISQCVAQVSEAISAF